MLTTSNEIPLTEGVRFRSLHRKLERAIYQIEHSDSASAMLLAILEQLCSEFEDELGFEGGRLYTRQDDEYVLCSGFGTSKDAPRGYCIPRDYPPKQRVLSEGTVLMARGDPGVDDRVEDAVGVRSAFAAFCAGEEGEHLIAFSLKPGYTEEDVLFSLSLVRHVVNLKLQQRRLAGVIDAARILQEGMLPRETPTFGEFEISAEFRPADVVSGDLYDYIRIRDGCLGIAIADSSGHGLPAALLARDAITALRAMAGQCFDVAGIVERVNGVIQRAAIPGTFVSMFYGQLSDDGVLEYCNAGHEMPLLVREQGVYRLDVGGTMMGLFPAARYQCDTVSVTPGDLLVLHTDGIVERQNRRGEFYGSDRIESAVKELWNQPAELVARVLMANADAFAEGMPAHDDATLVVVRRPCFFGKSSGEPAFGGFRARLRE